MVNLGMLARDKITGFEGIIVSKVNYLYGCAQYGLCPSAKENKVEDTHYFDDGRIEIIGKGVYGQDVTSDKPEGVNRDCPRY